MNSPSRPPGIAALFLALATAGCSTPMRQSSAGGAAVLTPAAQAKADGGRPAYTVADVKFMQGMIAHHAQALTMAALAPTNGARGDVRVLAERIDVAQRDEIDFMQRWLRERGEMVPDPAAMHEMAGHQMPMADMPGMLMPGMLSPEQMSELRSANGADFDRLFLTGMIQHHQGALTMVSQLFGTPGAGQDPYIWKFASDVEADQSSEIARMRTMLSPPSGGDRR